MGTSKGRVHVHMWLLPKELKAPGLEKGQFVMMNVVNTVAIVFSSETLDLFNMFIKHSHAAWTKGSHSTLYICGTMQAGGRDTDCSLVQGVSSPYTGSLLTISTGPVVASVLPAFLENVS